MSLQESDEYPFYARVAVIVICAILCSIGCLGNLITIAALVRYKKLCNSTTALVINLSAADMMFCMCVMPTRAAMFRGNYNISCGVFLFFFYGNVTVSLVTMVAIAINRYLVVLHNDLYQKVFTWKGTLIVIICAWLYSFLVWTVPLTGLWGKFESQSGTPFCRLDESGNSLSSPKVFLGFFAFVLPCLTITIAYIAIFYSMFKSTRRTSFPFDSTGTLSNRCRQREMKVTRVLLLAYCSFLVFFLPNFIILIIPSIRENVTALTVGEVLLWLSSCCNPFIYVLCSESYRQAYRALFTIDAPEVSERMSNLSQAQISPRQNNDE